MVRVSRLHPWPATVEEAARIQDRLRPLVRLAAAQPSPIRTAAGVDVAYSTASDRLVAVVAILNTETQETDDTAIATGTASFPYATGFLAFRELPTLVAALERLATTPDLLVCDGQGLAHPRRFGLACHLGVLTDLPSIGVAKTPRPLRPPGPRTRVVDRPARRRRGDRPRTAHPGQCQARVRLRWPQNRP